MRILVKLIVAACFAIGLSPALAENIAASTVVETEESAVNLIEKVKEGSDFAELAREHSTGPTAYNDD